MMKSMCHKAVAAMLTCIRYLRLCGQTSETTGLTLQGLSTVTVLLHRDLCTCVFQSTVDTVGRKSPPLIIRARCLLRLWAPSP